MARPYFTIQNDPWDLISFKQFGNEYFSDQLIVANANLNTMVNLDGSVSVQIPQVIIPVSVSPVVWGGTYRYA
jgi:hypothetical protein